MKYWVQSKCSKKPLHLRGADLGRQRGLYKVTVTMQAGIEWKSNTMDFSVRNHVACYKTNRATWPAQYYGPALARRSTYSSVGDGAHGWDCWVREL